MKKLIVMSMIACLAISTVACGAKEEAAPTEAETPTTEADAEAPAEGEDAQETPEAETEGETAAPASDKTWVIAMDTVFRPFEFTDEKGEFVGIDVDVIKAVAEDQGFAYEIRSLGWDAAVAAVQVGQADGLIAGASITDERKASGWIFSEGYYNATQTFVVPADSRIASYEDLSGKHVAVKMIHIDNGYA